MILRPEDLLAPALFVLCCHLPQVLELRFLIPAQEEAGVLQTCPKTGELLLRP